MTWYFQGSLVFADDPTGAHTNPRPVIVISNADRPYLEAEATVICLGTKADERYSHSTPVLPNDVIDNAQLKKTTYVLPWAIYTIPHSSIDDTLPQGRLTDAGMELIADAVDKMIRP
ncbi:hypothetical protein GCM10009000_107250 [Halobacterium noricense]